MEPDSPWEAYFWAVDSEFGYAVGLDDDEYDAALVVKLHAATQIAYEAWLATVPHGT